MRIFTLLITIILVFVASLFGSPLDGVAGFLKGHWKEASGLLGLLVGFGVKPLRTTLFTFGKALGSAIITTLFSKVFLKKVTIDFIKKQQKKALKTTTQVDDVFWKTLLESVNKI